MATVKQVIEENDVVELAHPAGRWPAGRLGAVLSDYGIDKLVEIADDQGQMLDLLQIPEQELRLVTKYSD
jgi:hypothetical protein